MKEESPSFLWLCSFLYFPSIYLTWENMFSIWAMFSTCSYIPKLLCMYVWASWPLFLFRMWFEFLYPISNSLCLCSRVWIAISNQGRWIFVSCETISKFCALTDIVNQSWLPTLSLHFEIGCWPLWQNPVLVYSPSFPLLLSRKAALHFCTLLDTRRR